MRSCDLCGRWSRTQDGMCEECVSQLGALGALFDDPEDCIEVDPDYRHDDPRDWYDHERDNPHF
jgi:hypothetical protein